MQEDIERKTIVLTTNAAKISGKLLGKLMAAALRKMKQTRDGPVHGKQTVKQLARQNAGLQNIEITDDNIKSFERTARKYGVDFALRKDGNTPPKWLVFFKARDADALTAAFAEFSKEAAKREKQPSVRETMRKFAEVIKNAVLTREPKQRERGGPEL